jgi:hypothetical protein
MEIDSDQGRIRTKEPTDFGIARSSGDSISDEEDFAYQEECDQFGNGLRVVPGLN